jgi:hypothetical protein
MRGAANAWREAKKCETERVGGARDEEGGHTAEGDARDGEYAEVKDEAAG